MYLNIKKIRKPIVRDESPAKIVKLAIEADKEEDHFDLTTEVKDMEFETDSIDKTIGNVSVL